MAARAGCVHLMFSMDRKLDRKGGAREYPYQHQPVPQGPPFPTNCTPATGSPPEAHKQSHKKPAALTTPKCTQCVHTKIPPHPHTPRLTSLPVWVEQHHLLTSLHASRCCRPSSRPGGHTTAHCLIDCKGLTFDLLTRPPEHLVGVKGHT